MNDLFDKVYDHTRSAWRFRWWGMILACIVAALGWLVVFALPDNYEASASVFVDTRTALTPVLQGLTVGQDVNVQLNYVKQSLLSGERLERIARESGVLPPGLKDPKAIAGILAQFAPRIVLNVRSASGRESERETGGSVYSFRYLDQNRDRSLKVTQIVLTTFVEETLGGKRAGAASAQNFMEEEIKTYEDRLRAAEARLADFKKANIGMMPTEQGGYFTQLQNEIDLAAKIDNELSVAVSQRSELSSQLRGEAVIGASAGVSSGGGATGAGDTVSRINETQARLDELLLRFTEKHPDVVATAQTLKDLKSRRALEIEQLRRGDAGAAASSGISSNPVYQSIVLKLNQADLEIASLRRQLSQHRSKAAELRKRLDIAPRVEAEFSQLTRDYDTTKQAYSGLLQNYEKAQLGDRADNAGSVRFEIVQPPEAAFVPVSPNRTMLLATVLIAALGAGGALAYGLHMLNPVVASRSGLIAMTELPVLGVVSSAFPTQLAQKARSELLRFLAAALMVMVLFVFVLVLNRAGWKFPIGGVDSP